VLLRKRLAQPAETFELGPLLADLRAQCIVGVVLDPSQARSGSDIPPYRFRRWLLAHTGPSCDIGPFLEPLMAQLPDFVAGGIRGQHPSEVLLHVVMEQVRRTADRSNLTLAPQRAALALAEGISTVRELARAAGVEQPPNQSYLLTNGNTLVASCSGQPVYFTRIRGIRDDPVLRAEPLFAGHRPKRVDHPTFRASILLAGPTSTPDGFEPMPDQSVAYIDRDYSVRVDLIDVLLASAE
jgi:hypothetical protein